MGERLQLEAEMQRKCEEAKERMRREQEEAEERKRREIEQEAERSRLAHEEAVRAEKAQQAEAERLAQEQERKALIATFLKEHGYSNVSAPKRTMLKAKYPIHTAAKTGIQKLSLHYSKRGQTQCKRIHRGRQLRRLHSRKTKKAHMPTCCAPLAEHDAQRWFSFCSHQFNERIVTYKLHGDALHVSL